MSNQLLARRTRAYACGALLLFACIAAAPTPARAAAQETDRERAFRLWDESKMTEALPLLEKLYAANERDPALLSRLGWALFVTSGDIKDPAARKPVRERARAILTESVQNGDDSNLTREGLAVLAKDDATDIPFSKLKEADAEMRAGESAFIKGDLVNARTHYERALSLDPHLYQAALYVGDMYFREGMNTTDLTARRTAMDKAGEWFARAISINDEVETAYRYWGDALMNSGRQEAARDKFIEGIIADPGSDSAYTGLTQWADTNHIRLGHPKIEVPTSVTPLQDNKLTINLDPKTLDDKSGAGAAWLVYGLTRANWAAEKFAKEFPGEKTYRHTLREEAEALHGVAQTARELMQSKKLTDPDVSLTNLLRLDEAGLLEPYILFVRADKGIVRDYAAYRRANRDKLHRYWAEIVVQKQ